MEDSLEARHEALVITNHDAKMERFFREKTGTMRTEKRGDVM